MSGRVLLYGATGYTGREVAARLAAADMDLVLAGRSADRVRAVAEPLGLPWRAVDLADGLALDRALAGVEVVLHAAGPFDETAGPMIAACLRAGVHYLDLSGEWPAFVQAMELGPAAEAAGIMIMPGVGLTIAATDCLMALAVRRWPDTVALRLGVSRPEVITRGTVVSAARLLSDKVVIRRNGALVAAPGGALTHAFDFGDGLRETTALSWADVVTGPFTTGVGDIVVYSELNWPQRLTYRASAMAMAVTGTGAWRVLGGALGAAWPRAPAEERRREAGFTMVVEALDRWRRVRRLRMRTLDGYTVSVLAAADAVRRVLEGQTTAGFQTPARVFGADFVLGLGCAVLEGAAAGVAPVGVGGVPA